MISSVIRDNEFLDKNEQLLGTLLITKYRYAFVVYLSNIIAVIFALPFILVRDPYYAHSVITFNAYLTLVPTLAVISAAITALVYHLNKERLLLQKESKYVNARAIEGMAKLNKVQGTLILIISVLYYSSLTAFFVVIIVLVITLFTIPSKSKVGMERILLFAAGVRNLAYGFSILLGLGGISYWQSVTGETGIYYRYNYLLGMTWIIILATALYTLIRSIIRKR